MVPHLLRSLVEIEIDNFPGLDTIADITANIAVSLDQKITLTPLLKVLLKEHLI